MTTSNTQQEHEDPAMRKLLELAVVAEGDNLAYILSEFRRLPQGARFYLAHKLEKMRLPDNVANGFSVKEVIDARAVIAGLEKARAAGITPAVDKCVGQLHDQLELVRYINDVKGLMASPMIEGVAKGIQPLTPDELLRTENILRVFCAVSDVINTPRMDLVMNFVNSLDFMDAFSVRSQLEDLYKLDRSHPMRRAIADKLEEIHFPDACDIVEELEDMEYLASEYESNPKDYDLVEDLHLRDAEAGTHYFKRSASLFPCAHFIADTKRAKAKNVVKLLRQEMEKADIVQISAVCRAFRTAEKMRLEETVRQANADTTANQLNAVKSASSKVRLKRKNG